MIRRPPSATRTDTPLPNPTLFRSRPGRGAQVARGPVRRLDGPLDEHPALDDRVQVGGILENAQVLQGVAVHHEQVGELAGLDRADRSEEHTYELQSLMRISYAVFCLKKKKKQNPDYTTT